MYICAMFMYIGLENNSVFESRDWQRLLHTSFTWIPNDNIRHVYTSLRSKIKQVLRNGLRSFDSTGTKSLVDFWVKRDNHPTRVRTDICIFSLHQAPIYNVRMQSSVHYSHQWLSVSSIVYYSQRVNSYTTFPSYGALLPWLSSSFCMYTTTVVSLYTTPLEGQFHVSSYYCFLGFTQFHPVFQNVFPRTLVFQVGGSEHVMARAAAHVAGGVQSVYHQGKFRSCKERRNGL